MSLVNNDGNNQPGESQRHQYNLGIVGNCAYMAHIDNTANVSWLCWPQFDSPSLFGSLLSPESGGHFYVRPAQEKYLSKQYYLENTNILCTEFKTDDGHFRVIDFAPRFRQYERYVKPRMLFRKLELLSGRPKIKVSCRPRGDYGRVVPEMHLGSNHIRYTELDSPVRLYADVPLTYIASEQEFILNRSQYLILTWALRLESSIRGTWEEYFQATYSYWLNWASRCSIGSYQQKAVIRSALALKLHQFEDTGAIIAAGTTSLPEFPESGRNWDYRYCWIRDAFYTLRALNNIGHFEELTMYSSFLQNIAVTEGGRFQPVYSVTGAANLEEMQLPLAGYLGNQPVRIGNQAYQHVQNDVYGQILVSLLPLYVDARFVEPRMSLPTLETVHQILDTIDRLMDESDAGLWEFRSQQQHHCYTYLFHWAGANAARRMAQTVGDSHMQDKAGRIARRAVEWIEKCYDSERGVYRQSVESNNLDASLLQLISMNYIDPRSEKAQQHLRRLEEVLMADDGLFYRYIHTDDFGKPKSTFLLCAYWYVDALACVGRVDDAIRVFDRLLEFQNPLGLMSEDIQPLTGSQWGNFPQAYSHVGLMNAAFRIARKLDLPDFL